MAALGGRNEALTRMAVAPVVAQGEGGHETESVGRSLVEYGP